MSEHTMQPQWNYACPACKLPLRETPAGLQCPTCGQTYPAIGGIPDFIPAGALSFNSSRIARVMNLVAPVYELRAFTSILLGLSGVRGGVKFIGRIAEYHAATLQGVTGTVLDVACGPATYTRRLASPARSVYGIDISMGVLQQGRIYANREGLSGVRLARASVESLPFADGVFNGAVCSGSLHLFPDKALALREIGRTLKPGAPLSVQTFVRGTTAINRLLQSQSWLHQLTIDELQRLTANAGFTGWEHTLDGIVLVFHVRKTRSAGSFEAKAASVRIPEPAVC